MRRLAMTAVVLMAAAATSANAIERYPFPELKTSWSGTRVMEAGGATMSSRVFQTPDRMRYETSGAGSMVVIHRQDLGVQWLLLSPGSYLETALDELEQGSPEDGVMPAGVRIEEQKDLGTRTVDGHATRGYRIVTVDEEGTRAEIESWVRDDGIPVLMDIASEYDGKPMTAVIRTSDIVVGPQPESLFELPPDATRLETGSVGAATMGGMMGGLSDVIAEEARAGAEEGARDAVREETRKAAEDSLRKGLKKLFGN